MHTEKKNVTIKSIAKELGVSFSTVSKALNDDPAVKLETKKMVIDKAKEMGYTPNSFAKGLKGNSTKTIAVIFNDIANPTLAFILRNIAVEMSKYGYTTIIFDSQYNENTEYMNIQNVLSRKPDFIILEPFSANTKNLQLLENLQNRLLLQGVSCVNLNCHYIYIDYLQGGYLAASELLSKGHKDCLVLTENITYPISEQFVMGIKKAFDEYAVPFDESRVITMSSSIQNGFTTMQSLWDNKHQKYKIPFTGVLTFDDNLAYGVYKSALHNRLKIPDDLSIVGFDDNPLSAFSAPPLTTIHMPKERLAEGCIKILKSVLIENRSETHIFTLEPTLVSRNSVAWHL